MNVNTSNKKQLFGTGTLVSNGAFENSGKGPVGRGSIDLRGESSPEAGKQKNDDDDDDDDEGSWLWFNWLKITLVKNYVTFSLR